MRRRAIWISVGLAMLIISQDPDRPKPGWTAESIAGQPIWNRLQESLKRLSSRSGRIIARNSGHYVMIDRSDVIVHGIQQLVADVRTPADRICGSTVVQ
jgi:hypothetical protein